MFVKQSECIRRMKSEAFHKYILQRKDEEVVIVSAGPSLNNLDKTKLREFCNGKFVIAVKQAIHLLDSCDLHVINDDNFEIYDYARFEKRPKVVYVKSSSLYKRVPKRAYDILYKIPRSVSSSSKSLAATSDFDKFKNLFETNLRPLGPGIMYELCIFLPLYFSSKKLHLFGWDIGVVDDDIIMRFYQKPGFVSKLNGAIANWNLQFYNRFYIHCENVLRYILFVAGIQLRINVPGITNGEAMFIADSTVSLFDFYERHGVEVTVYSQTSLLSERFQRAEL
jgi:hypothetical protein